MAFDAVLLLMVLSPGDTLLFVGGATVFLSSEESVPGLDAFEAFAGVVSSVVMSVSLVLFEPTGLGALLVVLSVPVGPDWLALVAFRDPVEADDALVALDAVSLLMLLSPGGTLLLVGGATVLVFADELLSGLDASEAFSGVVSSVVTPVSLVLFEPVPSATGGGPDASEAFAGVVSSVVMPVSLVLFEPAGLDALLVVLSVPVGPDWLALVAFGGQVEADDSLVALDAILLLMLSSPGDTLLLVDGATVLVFADELLPGLDAFEAFAGVVSSVVTAVSFVLFEPVPSVTGGAPAALLVALPLPVVPD